MKQEQSFFLCLLLFILLMCSCKSKETVTEINRKNRFSGDISVVSEKAKEDIAQAVKVAQIEEFTLIRETITIKEYDTDKEGSPIAKETVAEREYQKGVQASEGEEMERKTTEELKDSIHSDSAHLINEVSKEEVKEESVTSSFWKELGKWSGIGAVAVFILALAWKKIKKVLHL